jgi:Zn-dependent protease with chaperone function
MNSTAAQDPIAAARELLPAWTIWGNDVVFLAVSILFSAVLTQLGTWIALRPCRAMHPREWYEQARLLFPARRVVPVSGLLFSILIVICGFWLRHELSPFPRTLLSLIAALVTGFLILIIYRQVDAHIGSSAVSLRDAVRSVATRVMLLMPHLVIAFAVMAVMPKQFDSKALLLLALTAILAAFFVAGGNLFTTRLVGLAHPASPRLADITVRASVRTGVTAKGVYEIDWRMVNAMAFPLAKRLAFTKRAVETLTDEELEAICAHEFGHLAEPMRIHFFRGAVAVTSALFFPAIVPTAESFGIAGMVVLLCCLLAMNYSFAAVSRRLEKRADAVATAAQPADVAYARALEHLYSLNLIPAVSGLKCQTHPDLYDRMVASGVQPDFPRPPPPSRRRVMASLIIMLAPIPFAAAGFVAFVNSFGVEDVTPETTVYITMVLQADEASCLGQLGKVRDEAGDLDQAAVFFRAASTIDCAAWEYPANLARTCLRANRWEDAEGALRDARERRSGADHSAVTDDWFREMEESIEACREFRQKSPAERRKAKTR